MFLLGPGASIKKFNPTSAFEKIFSIYEIAFSIFQSEILNIAVSQLYHMQEICGI